MQVENIINNFKEQLKDFVAYESKMIDNGDVSVVDVSNSSGFKCIKTYPNSIVRVESFNGIETDFMALGVDTMCQIATEVEQKFRVLCNM